MKPSVTAFLPHGKTSHPDVALNFEVADSKLIQTRFVGRKMLKPTIDLANYAFNALIDWINIRVTVARPTQHQWIQLELRKFLPRDSRIDTVRAGAGNVSDTFQIRIQEPISIAAVRNLCTLIGIKFGDAAPATVEAIEISVDAYPRNPSDEARALILGVMQRTIFTQRDIFRDPMARPRCCKGDRSSQHNRKLLAGGRWEKNFDRYPWLTAVNHHAAWVDSTMYLGAKEDPVLIRIMDKVMDEQNTVAGGTCQRL